MQDQQQHPSHPSDEQMNAEQEEASSAPHPFAFPYTPHLRPGIIPYVPKLAMLTGVSAMGGHDEDERFILLETDRSGAFDHASIYADPYLT